MVLIAGAFYGWRIRETRLFFDQAALLSRFPAGEATAMSMDFAALRKAGLLAESHAALEPEYKAFLDGTGFDYRRDLDLVVASLGPAGNYFIARGRFDWARLREYAVRQGGSCYEQLCRMQGSRPDRRISFLPLRDDAMALAVSGDDLAAARMTKTGVPILSKLPDAPVWVSTPGSVLRGQGSAPPGIRMMLSAMAEADRVVLTMNAAGSSIEARLETNCHSQDEAKLLLSQLSSTTSMLKQALPRDAEMSRDDLAQALAAGVFAQSGLRVTGKWPVPKGLIESLTAGI